MKSQSPGRPRQFDTDTMLDQVIDVFRRQGFHATSVADLKTATGLTAGSLYKAFKDKRALFRAALDRYVSQRDALLNSYLSRADNGRARIHAALQYYADTSCGPEGRAGCLVHNSLGEIDTFDDALADHVHALFARLHTRFATWVEQGRTDGSIQADIDTDTAARYLVGMSQGLRTLGKSGCDQAQTNAVIALAMRAL